MEVKEAIRAARDYVKDVFAEERIQDLGLEEVELDDTDIWRVTIGFSRPWDFRPGSPMLSFSEERRVRTYKTISISNVTGQVLSVRNREVTSA